MNRTLVGFAGSLALATALLAACGIAFERQVAQPQMPGPADYSCGGLPQGACDLVVDDVLTRVGDGVVRVDLACVPDDQCSRSAGAGNARLALSDGTVRVRPWAYTGDPNPLPDPQCVNINLALCTSLAQQDMDQLPPTLHIASVQVTCLAVRGCSRGEGAVAVVVTDDQGLTHQGASDWWNGSPGSTAPPPDAKTPA